MPLSLNCICNPVEGGGVLFPETEFGKALQCRRANRTACQQLLEAAYDHGGIQQMVRLSPATGEASAVSTRDYTMGTTGAVEVCTETCCQPGALDDPLNGCDFSISCSIQVSYNLSAPSSMSLFAMYMESSANHLNDLPRTSSCMVCSTVFHF